MFSEEQNEMLKADLDGGCVKTRAQGGKTLSYIEGWKAIESANRIFGFDCWSRETVRMNEVSARTDAGRDGKKHEVCYVAEVRVTVCTGNVGPDVIRTGVGFGSGISGSKGDAIEGAVKEAETDAMKRALMTFGYQFGLALYDKEQEHVTGNGDDSKPAKPSDKPAPTGDTDIDSILDV